MSFHLPVFVTSNNSSFIIGHSCWWWFLNFIKKERLPGIELVSQKREESVICSRNRCAKFISLSGGCLALRYESREKGWSLVLDEENQKRQPSFNEENQFAE
jgi:hypothetical protein